MYQFTGLGRGGGGGGRGGGGGGRGGGGGGGGGGARAGGGARVGGAARHGGGHHGGGHHGGGHHHRGRGGGSTNVFVSDGGGWGPGYGWGPGWYEPVVVESTCAIRDESGECVCAVLNPDGSCQRPLVGYIGGRPIYGLGAEEPTSNAPAWIAGGLLVALAFGAFALEKKGPAPFRGRSA